MKTREMSRCLYYRDVYCEKSLFQTIISLHDRESNEAIIRTHNYNNVKILTGVHSYFQAAAKHGKTFHILQISYPIS
jgi:hypothetical protein